MNQLIDKKEILKIIRSFDRAVLVDIGTDGENVSDWLKANGRRVNCFGYLDKNIDTPIIDGIIIKDLKTLTSWCENAIIICLENEESETYKDVEAIGFKNILCIGKDLLEELRKETIHDKNNRIFYEKISYLDKSKYVKQSDTDVLLITPPAWDIYTPPAPLPCLAGALLLDNIKCEQLDLGILCFHSQLKNKWKEYAEAYLSQSYYEKTVKQFKKNPYNTYEKYVEDLWFFSGNKFPTREVKEKYHSMNRVQIGVLDGFFQSVANSLSVYVDFYLEKNIEKALIKYDKNILLDALIDMGVEEKLFNVPSIVGISLTGTNQFLPGCVLAKMLREFNPETRIIVGGSAIEIFLTSSYPNKNDLLKFFDYVITGEGETAIRKVVKNLKENDVVNYDGIPNLVKWGENGELILPEIYLEEVNELPEPCFEGINFDLYMAPIPMIPYQTSRGCFYGHCAFCNHNTKYRHNYRTKTPQKVVEELLHIIKKYGVTHFQFVDEAIRPDCFEQMVDEMDKHPEFKDTKWLYYSRVSYQYKKELVEKAKRNGCTMVMFGVETFNQRLLQFIMKGISAEASKYSLKLFSDAGIKTYMWLMYNLPSETIEEMRQDIADVKEYIKYVSGVGINPFMLDVNTDMYRDMERFNIISYNPYDTTRFDSVDMEGNLIDKDKVFEVSAKEYTILRKKYFYTNNRYTVFFDDMH